MHILFLVPYAPSLIRTRPYNLIHSLRRRGHDITLLTLTSTAADVADLDRLRDEGIVVISEPLPRVRSLANSVGALATSQPLQASYCWQPNLAARLRALLDGRNDGRPVDIVHVEHLRGARYALAAREAAPRIPVVWDSVDCISHLFRQAAAHSVNRFSRWMARLELPRTERYEGRLAWQFNAVLTTSAVDRRAIEILAAGHRPGLPPLHVLPNGVDLAYFQPDPTIQREPATILLSGKMSYHANVSMAVFLVQKVMPLVWLRCPDARVLIVGKDPTSSVAALAGDRRVAVTGYVADMRPYLQRATLAVAPITYGAGIQNKVLEAMACGTPVVASSAAATPLSAVPGRDLLVGDSPDELASAILTMLAAPLRRDAISAAGRSYVEARHNWARIAAQLDGIYETLLVAHRTQSRPVTKQPLAYPESAIA